MRNTLILSALALSMIACPDTTTTPEEDMSTNMDMAKTDMKVDMPAEVDMTQDMAKEDMTQEDMTQEDMAQEDMTQEDMPTSGFGCPDAQEPNDTKAEAHDVSDGSMIEATICEDDVDLYKITLTAGQMFSATAAFEATTDNLDLTLFTAEQAENFMRSDQGVAFTFDVAMPTETLTHQVADTGDYYLLVFNNNETTADYTLEISAP